MTAVLRIESVQLTPEAVAFDFAVAPDERIAVMGPAGSGKSRLLALLAPHAAVPVTPRPRSTPQALAQAVLGRQANDAVAEALDALRLWDRRRDPIAGLPPSARIACRLIGAMRPAPLVVIDGELDGVDPWTRAAFLDRLEARAGIALVVATHQPEIAERLGAIALLAGGELRYRGAVQAFVARFAPTLIEVEADDVSAARSVVDPFEIHIAETETGLRLEAPDGQAVAARLLTRGYGSVRAIMMRRPSLAEALDRALVPGP
jgi:ABC-2 type transport system ATP-binding protein